MNRNSRGMRRSNGGPLMTSHLKNIDLELELLKRKREMIEQQQLLLMDEELASSRQYDYDSMIYEDREPRGSSSSFGRKRSAEPHWNKDSIRKKGAKKSRGGSYSASDFGRSQRSETSARRDYTAVPPLMDIPTNKPKKIPYKGRLYSPPRSERHVSAPVAKTLYGGVKDMLLPNKTPSLQVNGRLELVLGAVLKDIREKHGSQSPHLLRAIKEAIRERVRAVMLGKVVGSLTDNMKIYREEFPLETDIDILNIAQAAVKRQQEKNMHVKHEVDTERAKQSGEPAKFNVEQSIEDDLKSNFIKLIETKLRDMLAEMESLYSKQKQEELDANNANPNPMTEKSEPTVTGSEPTATGTEPTEPAITGSAKPAPAFYNKEKSISDNFAKLYKIIDPPDMREIMPRLIKKHLNMLSNMLFLNEKFTYEREELIKEAKDVLASVKRNERLPRPTRKAPYFVKVMGCPTLPKKWVMQVFLDQFNPSMVKKHKTIHNLLFVGLSNKQDYDAVIAANGARIGNLIISTKTHQKPADDSKDDAGQVSDAIDSELDNQISDLLNSIRNAEEDTDKDTSKDDELSIIENDEASKVIDVDEPTNVIDLDEPMTNEVEDKLLETDAQKPEAEEGNKKNETAEVSEESNLKDNDNTEITDAQETSNLKENENTKTADVQETTEAIDNTENGDTNSKPVDEVAPITEEIKPTDDGSLKPVEEEEKVDELNTKVGTRSSARLASTPSRVQTRRASKLAQNE